MGDALESLGFVVDASKFTVGDILDLSDEQIPLTKRLEVLNHGIVQGDLRSLPLVRLPELIAILSAELNKQANPT